MVLTEEEVATRTRVETHVAEESVVMPSLWVRAALLLFLRATSADTISAFSSIVLSLENKSNP